jgi:mannosyl-3-phosphoglycerate synthase
MIPPPKNVDIQKFASSLEEHFNDYSMPKGRSVWAKLPVLDRKAQEAMKVLFTDLDGTLLHPVSYSYTAALDSVRMLQEERIPIIFCSAKTMGEQQVYRKELDIKAPFIVENGAAIFIPKDYFRFPFSFSRIIDDYFVVELGIPYEEVREKMKSLCGKCEAQISGFGDLSIEEVAKVTGLNLLMAELAKKREYSETLIIEGNKKQVKAALDTIEQSELSYTFGGKFYEVYQGGDKGKAVKILIELFKLNFGNISTIGLGDSLNDIEMLAAVDLPILVQGQGNRWSRVKVKNLKRVKGVGPKGWSQAASELISQR